MRRSLFIFISMLWAAQATAFCGFYVAHDDGALYNKASKVVFAREGNRSRITMASDYSGPISEFAMIVPTPAVLRKDQIRTVDPAAVVHLENYTAPRLVEYFDRDPCNPILPLPVPVVMQHPAHRHARINVAVRPHSA